MMFIVYTNILLLFIHHGECLMKATAVLYRDGSNTTCGTLTFIQNDASTSVNVTGLVSGINATSEHGFHVHTNPVSEHFPNCSAPGSHFNPYNTSHGPRTANITSRHVGDLGNLTTDVNGSVYVNIMDSIIQLFNITQSIMNRTIIIHLNRDDGGLGNYSDSTTTGNSGARILCGLIKLYSDDSNTTTTSSGSVTTSSAVIPNIKFTTFILLMTIIFACIFFY